MVSGSNSHDHASVGGEAVLDKISIYQLTESGLALQATVKGTKYWLDEELNQPSSLQVVFLNGWLS